jgi:hypothetical protein
VLVLVDVEDILCEDPLDVLPDVFALVFEVSVACEPVPVVEATTPPEVLVTASPAVIITGMYGWSVPVYVSVLIPGSFASYPPNDSAQTADVVPASEQSK